MYFHSGLYNTSEPVVELYEFIPCYPGFFGINCMRACHCDASCICDPVVGCINCEQNTECDAIHKTPRYICIQSVQFWFSQKQAITTL